jgi:hypothetical protein
MLLNLWEDVLQQKAPLLLPRPHTKRGHLLTRAVHHVLKPWDFVEVLINGDIGLDQNANSLNVLWEKRKQVASIIRVNVIVQRLKNTLKSSVAVSLKATWRTDTHLLSVDP